MSARTAVGTVTPGADVRGFLARNRVAVLLGTLAFCGLLLVSWLGRDAGAQTAPLDPGNPNPSGARALAQVLEDRGVEVDVVRGQDSFEDAALDGRTTVVVTNPDQLSPTTWENLERKVATAPDAVLVVVGLTEVVADGFDLGAGEVVPVSDRTRTPADCSPASSLFDGLSLTADDAVLGISGDGCFGDPGPRLLHLDRTEGGGRWLLAVGSPLSNADIDRDQNAAVALRLLGQRDRVVWYVADGADVPVSEGVDLGRLLPDWLIPAGWLLAAAAVALLLQRGRRLGPLAVEPLPVSIKALESTTALGRLYEKARDRRHAATLLVDGSATRLTTALGLDPAVGRDELVRAVAARTSRPHEQVAALLPRPDAVNTHVRNDTDLVTLAQNLTQLEEEVRNA